MKAQTDPCACGHERFKHEGFGLGPCQEFRALTSCRCEQWRDPEEGRPMVLGEELVGLSCPYCSATDFRLETEEVGSPGNWETLGSGIECESCYARWTASGEPVCGQQASRLP